MDQRVKTQHEPEKLYPFDDSYSKTIVLQSEKSEQIRHDVERTDWLVSFSRAFKLNRLFSELNGSQFYGLDSLRHLRLSFNKISRINRNAFAGVYRLETLYLDKNKITNIHPITFRGLASLKLLSLEGNSIKSIHPTTFITLVLGNLIPFSSLQIIKLNNNFLEVSTTN